MMPAPTKVMNVIVQAGGKGTRLEQYSWNKPKCLVPVDGKPLIYHTFDAFPEARFLIISDYKKDIVSRFLEVFRPEVTFEIVEVEGTSGNVAGIPEAVSKIDPSEPVTVVWCDLKFDEPPAIAASESVVVGTTQSFTCRWSVQPDGSLAEKRSDTTGIIGLFAFPKAEMLLDMPRTGEFVDWLSRSGLPTASAEFNAVKEIGTVDALLDQWSAAGHARFFNSVDMLPDRVVKRAKLPEFQPLLEGEAAWYKHAAELGFRNMPTLISDHPLTISRIQGKHPFEFAESMRGREAALHRIMQRLEGLHALESGAASDTVGQEVYAAKTLQRLDNIRRLLPELETVESFRVNGTPCRNILHPAHQDWFRDATRAVLPNRFHFIHGDPTFSNMLLDAEGEPWFIDPRGKFGSSWFLGDANYDWAKLYYSVAGEYDNFNRRQFVLEMQDRNVTIQIRPGGWAHLKGAFKEFRPNEFRKIRGIHGLIWLSLSGYVSDDYDSILASFFMGLLTLEEALA
jgi:GTP:adenosylcobinamide-phosphate guanylyltransferase